MVFPLILIRDYGLHVEKLLYELDCEVISIVIVNWNSGWLLENCVQSLLRNARGSQIIVVDNASVDSSLHFIAGTKADLLVLRNERNIGFAAGNNLGWHAGKGELILFLNPDTECFPESVSCLEQTLMEDRHVWAVGGHLVSPSGQPRSDFNVRPFPTVGRVAAEMMFLDEIWPSGHWSRSGRAAQSSCAVDVDQPAAACLMVARTALESIGGFDEAFHPAWFEDVDLCRQIRNKGGRIQYQPGARFLHYGGYSLNQISRREFLEFYHTNQIRYFQKHHGSKAAARVKKLVILGLVLRSVFSLAYPLVPDSSRLSSAKTFWSAALRIRQLCEVLS